MRLNREKTASSACQISLGKKGYDPDLDLMLNSFLTTDLCTNIGLPQFAAVTIEYVQKHTANAATSIHDVKMSLEVTAPQLRNVV